MAHTFIIQGQRQGQEIQHIFVLNPDIKCKKLYTYYNRNEGTKINLI